MKSAKKTVIQGGHRDRIIGFYAALIDAARDEFSEDNKPTLDAFLEDCHKKALNRSLPLRNKAAFGNSAVPRGCQL